MNEKHYVSHKDGDTLNNRVENLFINTPSELGKRNIATGKSRPPDYTKYTKKEKEKMKSYSWRAVKQYDINGRYIKTYKSINKASEDTGVHASSIGANARGIYKTAGGFLWKYAEDK